LSRFHLWMTFLLLPTCVCPRQYGPECATQDPSAQTKQEKPPQGDSSKPASPETDSADKSQSGQEKQVDAGPQQLSQADRKIAESEKQPKRILGIMPNYRAVSAGAIPRPPSPKQAFVIATKNSFDYSSFVFVGLTSMVAEGTDVHPQLGKGVAGFGRYYWRGYLDKTDGNYMVIAVLPTLLHEDERYFAMGHAGGFWKRLIYSGSRVAVARNYEGENTPNVSELLGRGIAEGVSISYYPSRSRTAGAIATKYGYAILRDAATNMFREFWPDIATHVLHRHP
jgi:hypothetical protein